MSFCNSKTREEFDKLKAENENMREYMSELHGMLHEIIKVRKSVIERKTGETDSFDNKFLIQVKNEMLSLKEGDMDTTCMAAIKENLIRFRDFMEKVDSATFNTPLEKAYQFNSDADIDEIKNIAKLKELISKKRVTQESYKYVVNSQDLLLQRAVARTNLNEHQGYKIESKRMNILDESGLEKANQFIEDQKKYLTNSKAQFVSLYVISRRRQRS